MTSRNVKNFEFRLGRQGILLFVGGMSFLLLLVFILGVMVGVHIDAYPEKIARELPEIVRRQLHHPAEKVEKAGGEEVKNPKATGENNALATFPIPPAPKMDDPKRKSLMNDEKALSAAIVSPSSALTAPADKIFPETDRSDGAKPAVSAPALQDKGNKSHPDDSGEAPVKGEQKGEGKYLVQLASLKNYEKAKQFCKKIKPLGYNPKVQVAELPKKGRWFRVVIDGFATRDEARKTASVLSEKIEGLNCIIRQIR